MKRFLSHKPLLLAGLLSAALASAGAGFAGAGTQPALADASNTENVSQAELKLRGNEIGSGAFSGQAMAFNMAPTNQVNVQVIAGDQFTRDNSTQTALNAVDLEQASIAATGETKAAPGGVAVSGPAVSGNLATIRQMNIQVIAGRGCEVDQIGSNTLNLSQQAGAASGDATAEPGGSAFSGAASAINRADVSQRNIQIYVCRNGSAGEQVASNDATLYQSTLSVSGAASAVSGGSAASGVASTLNRLDLDQHNLQITID